MRIYIYNIKIIIEKPGASKELSCMLFFVCARFGVMRLSVFSHPGGRFSKKNTFMDSSRSKYYALTKLVGSSWHSIMNIYYIKICNSYFQLNTYIYIFIIYNIL